MAATSLDNIDTRCRPHTPGEDSRLPPAPGEHMVHLMWATCCGSEELANSLDRSFKQTSRIAHCRALLASSLQTLLLGANSANVDRILGTNHFSPGWPIEARSSKGQQEAASWCPFQVGQARAVRLRSWFVPRIDSSARAPESETFVTVLSHDQVQQAKKAGRYPPGS